MPTTAGKRKGPTMGLFAKNNNVEKRADALRALQMARLRLDEQDLADRAHLADLRASLGDAELNEVLGIRPARSGGFPSSEELTTDPTVLRATILELEAK